MTKEALENIVSLSLALVFASALSAQEPVQAAGPVVELPSAVAASRLPILTDRMRDSNVSEAELRALLETALGSGVSVHGLVGALEVVVHELEAGTGMPDLALSLPGLIVQGFEGDSLASMLRAASESASATVAVPMPAPEAPSEISPE